MGKLIIIEGTDGSGKETQTKLLTENLKKLGYNVLRISFPNYESNASYPVKMFLAGEFGEIDKISYYASSSFYAIDRYASFKKDWEEFYENGGIVISDRYTISNIIHQANRITDEKTFDSFCDWIIDLEWNKFKIPRPDKTIFLDVPYDFSNKLMANRLNKITGSAKKDIMESDENQKFRAYMVAKKISKKYDFSVIKCVENDELKSIEEIQEEVLKEALKAII